ncbi:MAG: hypothetical protein RL721_2090, partial [Candidatus Eisenbacteria bacterium]
MRQQPHSSHESRERRRQEQERGLSGLAYWFARTRAKVDKLFDSRKGKRELVTVELVVPKVRGMKLRIRAEHPIFP